MDNENTVIMGDFNGKDNHDIDQEGRLILQIGIYCNLKILNGKRVVICVQLNRRTLTL